MTAVPRKHDRWWGRLPLILTVTLGSASVIGIPLGVMKYMDGRYASAGDTSQKLNSLDKRTQLLFLQAERANRRQERARLEELQRQGKLPPAWAERLRQINEELRNLDSQVKQLGGF